MRSPQPNINKQRSPFHLQQQQSDRPQSNIKTAIALSSATTTKRSPLTKYQQPAIAPSSPSPQSALPYVKFFRNLAEI
jgi:hypothetical protein